MLSLFLALAGAPGAVPDDLRPVAAPADIRALYRAHATAQGRADVDLACRDLAEGLVLCFAEGGRTDYVTTADLGRWGVDLAAVEARAGARAAAAFGPDRPAAHAVEGMVGRYWATQAGDGLDAAGLLLPERLLEIAGGNPVVAVPDQETLLFWLPGDGAFDKVLAVGVARMYEAADRPVSPRLYRWDGERWKVWGEAVPATATP